jgi:uncharacterized protein YodC (DUF2158 family)
MSDELQVGDVVYLKSGSPELTITEKLDDGSVTAEWFDGKLRYSTYFSPVCLTSEKPQ